MEEREVKGRAWVEEEVEEREVKGRAWVEQEEVEACRETWIQ